MVELLISLAIVGIVSAILIANLRGGGQAQELRFAADNLASLIRRAQILSLSGAQVNAQVPVGGYGINLSQCSSPPCDITLFTDFDGQLDFDGGGEFQESVRLAPSIQISAAAPSSPLNIVFKPPQPLVCFNRDCFATATAIITLRNSISGQTRAVQVHQASGQVTVQ